MKRIFSFLSVFVMVFCLTVPAFAYDYNDREDSGHYLNSDGTVAETFIELYERKGGYLYYQYGSNARNVYHSDKELVVSGTKLVTLEDSVITMYVYSNSPTPGFYERPPDETPAGYALGGVLPMWSSHELKYRDGTVYLAGDPNFIPPPLAEMVLALSGEELVTVAVPEMVGAMKVLVPCGVGLTALLVGLKLFGKRSLISRS